MNTTTRALITLLALFGLAGSPAAGQTPVAFAGRVVGQEGESLPFAQVTHLSSSRGTVADEFGVFRLDSIPPGEHLFAIDAWGRLPDTLTLNVQGGAVPTVVELALDPSDDLNLPPPAIPTVFEGRMKVGLRQSAGPRIDNLSMLLISDHTFSSTGYSLLLDTYQRPGRLDVMVYGAYGTGWVAGAMISPATATIELGPLSELPIQAYLHYQGVTDTLVIDQEGWLLRMNHISGDQSIRSDSLVVALPGSTHMRCVPAGVPREDCEALFSSVSHLGTSWTASWDNSETITPVFGTTTAEGRPEGIAWTGLGQTERDFIDLVKVVRCFTSARQGRASPTVSVRTWSGHDILCRADECSVGGAVWNHHQPDSCGNGAH